MAITRIAQAGFETGNLLEISNPQTNSLCSNEQAKTGSYSYKPAPNTSGYSYWQIPATRQVRFGFWIRYDIDYPEGYCCQFRTNSANIFSVETIYSTFGITIDIGGINQDSKVSQWTNGTWFHIGVDCKIDSSAGWIKVYIGGVEKLSMVGNTGNVDITQVCFGNVSNRGNNTVYFDDMYLDDTTGEAAPAPVPMKRFFWTIANADGNYSNWDGSDGNKVSNYQLVDDVPSNGDTDYVTTTVTDTSESYNNAGRTLGAGETCIAVIPVVTVKRSGVTEQLAVGTRSTGGDALGADQTPGSSYGLLWERQTTKPGGGAWDQAAIDAMEILFKSRGTY